MAGSLLDDNQWHDVQLLREDKNVTVSVDRVPVNITIDGEFTRLDLDRYVSVCVRFPEEYGSFLQFFYYYFLLL